ncbi:MAG: hypothetical protein S4CHLAM102_01270 [Chlamydiia bacterium]|nr:hypothetical protein [Chlamydiia bacterium]
MYFVNETILLVHAFATWMMIGIVWFVQVVYYPLYKRLSVTFSDMEKRDLKNMGYLVAPIFFFEAISAVILVWIVQNDVYHILAGINLLLLVFVWIISWIIQFKHHKTQDLLFIHRMHHILLSSNWLRTLVWSIRGFVVLMMIAWVNRIA